MIRSFTKTSAVALALAVATSSFTVACKKKGGSSAPTTTSSPRPSKSGKVPFPETAQLVEPPIPVAKPENPLRGARLFVDPESNAMLKANSIRKTDPFKAELLDRIAKQPQGLWMGNWNSNIFRAVDHFVQRAKAEGAVPVMIAYNIPLRDCGQYSSGGLSTKDGYMRWIRNVQAGIGNDAAVVVLEPDALSHLQECLTDAQKKERIYLISDAVRVLRLGQGTAVYLDSGHPAWNPAEVMAERLKAAGVEYANGFSLNVSNYRDTEECIQYGKKISALLGGKHFIIDTSRNGAGPYTKARTEEETWCNPPGRKIGTPPTTQTGEPLCDAFLWLKRPGESDGECGRGEPKAGVFWMEQALGYAMP